MRKQLLTTALILGLASAPVWAISGQTFNDFDADGNGSLSKQEADAVGIRLEQVDTNGDGQISQSEYKQATQGQSDPPRVPAQKLRECSS